jgi:hypothetical protein
MPTALVKLRTRVLGGTELTAAFFDLVRDAAPAQLSSVFFAAGKGVQARSTRAAVVVKWAIRTTTTLLYTILAVWIAVDQLLAETRRPVPSSNLSYSSSGVTSGGIGEEGSAKPLLCLTIAAGFSLVFAYDVLRINGIWWLWLTSDEEMHTLNGDICLQGDDVDVSTQHCADDEGADTTQEKGVPGSGGFLLQQCFFGAMAACLFIAGSADGALSTHPASSLAVAAPHS